MKYLAPEESRTQIGNLKYLEDLRILARNNRKNPTQSEKMFWSLVSYSKLNFKFTKQKPLGRCIIDFYCSKLLLDIEIDGDSHDFKKFQDEARDLYLTQRDIKTIRYKSFEVINNLKQIKTDLIKQIQIRLQEIS